ncbi:MAG: hypothetical protein ACXWCR_14665, partial [Flavitalea sp.]
EKGFRNPGSPKPTPTSSEPRGWDVLPGNYKVVLSAGKLTDSTMVTVKGDPRLSDRTAILTAQRKMQTALQQKSERLIEGMDRLTEAETIANKIQAQLKDVEGKDADSLRKTSKAVIDSIKVIREYISGKPQTRQGYGNVPQITVLNQFSAARSALGSKVAIPGKQEQVLVDRAEAMINSAVGRINNFFIGQWVNYRRQVEGNPVKLFKDYAPL